jgi:uncharacterized membrane protein YfcA
MIQLILLGLFTGFLNGSLGIGGGFIIVPYYIYILELTGHVPFGTSLASFPLTALSSAVAHRRLGNVKFLDKFWPFIVAAMLGGLIGGYMGKYFSTDVPRVVFSIAAILAALRMFFGNPKVELKKSPSMILITSVGLFAGIVSGLTGLGGGVIFVPALCIICGLEMCEAVAFSVITMIGTTSLGTLGHMFNNTVAWEVAGVLMIGSIAGAPIGAMVASKMPDRYLKKAFALLILGIGIKVLIDVWR